MSTFAESDLYLSDFGVDASVGGVSCRGVYDAPYAEIQGMANDSPTLLIATADLPALAIGQAVSVPAGNFTVREIQPDGTGFATLVLRKA